MKKLLLCLFAGSILLFTACESAYYALYGVNEGLKAAIDEIDQIYGNNDD